MLSSISLSLVVSVLFVCLLRFWGFLEPYELKLLDGFFLSSRSQPIDEEIVLVTITEEDIERLEQYPLSDRQLVQILESIIKAQPRVIGLDLLRDFKVYDKNLSEEKNQRAYQQLQTIFRQTDNLYGIAKITEAPGLPSIPGASIFRHQERLTAVDLVLDRDGVARKGNLYPDYEQETIPGLGLATALKYLEREGIQPREASRQKSRVCPLPRDYPKQGWLQLGSVVLCPLTPRFGGYANENDSGYQILINWHSCQEKSFPIISLGELLDDNLNPELIKDRLVLIGNTSLSGKDFFFTPCSQKTGDNARQISGVELHAHLARQIIGMARGTLLPISAWKETSEIVWITMWAICLQITFLGFIRVKSRFFWLYSLINLLILASILYYLDLYLFESRGLWLPLLPVWSCFALQSLFNVFIFFVYLLKQSNNALEVKVRERTKSLQKALDNLQALQQKMIDQEKINFLGKNTLYISHEIRNPLGALELANLISLELIKTLAQKESLSHEQVSLTKILDNSYQIEQYIERINRIIVQLNNYTKSSELPSIDCDLERLIDEALEITIYSFGIRHHWTESIQIEKNYDPNLPPVQLYRSDFERAICNLIDNSFYSLKQKQTSNPDFSPRLWLTTKKLDEQVQIILEDNGEGIAPEDEGEVFEEFYSTKGDEGTGLGLFLVKQIIEGKHNGRLNLQTKWGEFTRITISIPLTKID